MAKKIETKSAISNAQKLGIGVGLTSAAIAAAGAYFLYGSKQAPRNRKIVKGWAIKAKGEVLEAIEKAEQITEDEFNKLVNTVVTTYGKAQKLSKNELADFTSEMSDSWKGLVKMGMAKKAGVKKAITKAPAKKVAPAKKAAVQAAPKKVAKK